MNLQVRTLILVIPSNVGLIVIQWLATNMFILLPDKCPKHGHLHLRVLALHLVHEESRSFPRFWREVALSGGDKTELQANSGSQLKSNENPRPPLPDLA